MNTYNYDLSNIIEEVKNLISHSIVKSNYRDENFSTLHRAIIKKYFESKNVKINYQDQSVDMDLPVGNRKYTRITFECQELERFLMACIKEDEKSLHFYDNILTQYKALSAA